MYPFEDLLQGGRRQLLLLRGSPSHKNPIDVRRA
jgi:hypothetical protein